MLKKNTNVNLTITRLGCSYKQFHVAPPGEWYSLISVTTLVHSHKWWVCVSQHQNNLLILLRLQYKNTNENCLGYDMITDMMLLLLRNHSDAFRHRKCLIPLDHTATTPGTGLLLARSVAGPKVGDYFWHGTTPGP